MHVVAYAAERLISGTLDRLAVDLQLGQMQFVRATQGYSGVTTWLGAEGSALQRWSPYLFPQGSLALDTTVRPILSGEFDLDVICRVAGIAGRLDGGCHTFEVSGGYSSPPGRCRTDPTPCSTPS